MLEGGSGWRGGVPLLLGVGGCPPLVWLGASFTQLESRCGGVLSDLGGGGLLDLGGVSSWGWSTRFRGVGVSLWGFPSVWGGGVSLWGWSLMFGGGLIVGGSLQFGGRVSVWSFQFGGGGSLVWGGLIVGVPFGLGVARLI